MQIDTDKLLPIIRLKRANWIDESGRISKLYAKLLDFLEKQKWCEKVQNAWVAWAYYDIIGVFLFKYSSRNAAEPRYIWVVGGFPSLPYSASVSKEFDGLIVSYLDEYTRWAEAILQGGSPTMDRINFKNLGFKSKMQLF